MFMRRILPLVLLLTLIACNRNSVNKPKDMGKNQVESSEDFILFFSQFKSDSVFQRSRIVFPLNYETLNLDTEETKIETENITGQEWKYNTFYWDSTYAKRALDAYTQDILISPDTVKINYNGVDNGINMQLIFICIQGKWFYIKMIDHST
jgi:hypothetical protein